MSLISGLDREERRLLEVLNAGGAANKTVFKREIERLLEAGLISESSLGDVHITPRGQLELARWRFRNIPKPRYVAFSYPKRRSNIWGKLFR